MASVGFVEIPERYEYNASYERPIAPAPIQKIALTEEQAKELLKNPRVREQLLSAAIRFEDRLSFQKNRKLMVTYLRQEHGNYFVRVNLVGKRTFEADGSALFKYRDQKPNLKLWDKIVEDDDMQGFATLMATGEVTGDHSHRPYVVGTVWKDIVGAAKNGELNGAALLKVARKHASVTGKLEMGSTSAFQRAIWGNMFPDPKVRDAAQRMVNVENVNEAEKRLKQK